MRATAAPTLRDTVSATFRRASKATAPERAALHAALVEGVAKMAAGAKIDDDAALDDSLRYWAVSEAALRLLVAAQRLAECYATDTAGVDAKLDTLERERNTIGPRLDEIHGEILTLEKRRRQLECEIVEHCRAKTRRDSHRAQWPALFGDIDAALTQLDAGIAVEPPRTQWEVR